MAGNVRILGHITNVSQSSGEADIMAEFIINYFVTGVNDNGITGQTHGELVVLADVTTSEALLTKAIKTGLAALVDPLVLPPQSFTFADVQGCNI